MESKERRRMIERGKTLLILLLTLSALFLMSRSNLGASLGAVLWQKDNRTDLSHSQKSGQEDRRVWPVRMAVQNEKGRYGVQYDEGRLEELFTGQLGNLLGELLGMTQRLTEIPEAIWRETLLSQQVWVYYDFLGNIPLSRLAGWLGGDEGQTNQNLYGQARAFLLTEVEGRKVLYGYSQDQARYFRCEVDQALSEGGGRLSAAVSQYLPNGMVFAVEDPETYRGLWPYGMILPALPSLPRYQTANALEDLEEEDQDQLLQDLSFLPKVSTQYSSADELVIREGVDTLRILRDGAITFSAHNTESAQARYPVENWSVDRAVEESRSILGAAIAGRIGEARSYCMGGEELDDGRIRVTFGYLLSGAHVHVGNTGWAAEFWLRDGYVESFTIYLRRYEKLDETVAVLPEKQALAALTSLGKENCELMLCYTDTGDGVVGAGWYAR